MEYIISALVGGFLTLLLVPFFIKFFNRKKLGQITREEGPTWHEAKTGTPTMGGTVFIGVILVLMLIFGYVLNLYNGAFWMLFMTFLLFGGIGFVDDFLSIFRQQNEGLKARQKFIAQIVFSILIGLIAWVTNQSIFIPFFSLQITNIILVAIFIFIWITGFSNAVNLTDGLDGLATGLNIIAYLTYFFIARASGHYVVSVVSLLVAGSLMGFLVYNIKPAKIFMGDVGSLALGAGLAVISIILNNPWSLLIVGIVFVIETLSVILQVISFKTTGKRIFKMSPIHHHFEMIGWSESKVVTVFWIVGAFAAIITFVWIA